MDVAEGKLLADDIDEATIGRALDTHTFPDPDLIIRTGEEHRLSNFLIWQAAYSELIFLNVLWPDFGELDLIGAIQTFASRERRFGGLKSGAA